MIPYKTLTVRTDDRGVVYATLDRPDKRNALSAVLMDELTELAATIGHETATRAIVLAGAGPAFCAGGDLDWMMAQINADRPTRMSEARRLACMLGALNEMPTPLIGRVHGSAMGGGVGLACVCDVVIAADSTKFGLTETRLGLIPATIGPYVIARMGEGRARRVFMSSRIFEAAEARDLGIVSRTVSAADLDTAVEAEVAPYLSAAPGAVGAAKALARALGPRIDAEVIEETIRRLADVWESEEATEGISAFLGKRPAKWR
jgi:methylglutaconyl-CoA hydratase